jgi:hypothetical protein
VTDEKRKHGTLWRILVAGRVIFLIGAENVVGSRFLGDQHSKLLMQQHQFYVVRLTKGCFRFKGWYCL